MTENASQLAELARQVRGDTLKFLAAAPDKWLTWAPEGTSNHFLWHAGHAVWLQDVLFIEPLTGKSELPAGWAETFGMDCRPVKLTNESSGWPKRTEIERRLRQQLARVVELLAKLPTGKLAVNAASSSSSRSLVSSAIHAWHDEAKHQGEMYLLLKLQRARAEAAR